MTVHDDDYGNDGDFISDDSWWSRDEHPLQYLVEFVAAGSRLIYEYSPIAKIGGMVGTLEVAPIVGVVRYADHHEFVTGVHFVKGDKKVLVDYNELAGMLKLLDRWLNAECVTSPSDRPRVAAMRYETRNGLIIESIVGSRLGESARISVASPEMLLFAGSHLQELFQACQAIMSFLDELRG